jgi:hypothetical protein
MGMARKRSAICERCGRRFTVCRFNRHHQKFCTHPACVAERRRERRREHYRRKYRHDAAFREAEQKRCREALQRRRKQGAGSADTGAAETLPAQNVELVTAALVAQMIDSSDPIEVFRTVRRLEHRGRRLAVAAASPRGSPQ